MGAQRPHGGDNVLLAAAHPLLDFACMLRLRRFEAPLEPLRERLCTMVEAFEAEALRAGVDAATRVAARYCICTFVDEIVSATPAGGGGAWASASLLILFHAEASGGERFFSILTELSNDPDGHLDVLELIDAMLALGMEGRYRLMTDGPSQLERVRSTLRQRVTARRGLRAAWPSAPRTVERKRRGGFPLSGAVIAGSLAGLALLAAILGAHLRSQAQPVIDTLARIHAVPAAPSAPMKRSLAGILEGRLANDIAARRVAVAGSGDGAVLTLGGDGLFASGSATVRARSVALLKRIGAALRDLDVRVVVVGHADDEPPSSGRPSNWQLSLSRAVGVVDLLREGAGDADRFLAQGRGASAPIASNGTAASRARNRRVVIAVSANGTSF